MKTSIRIFSLAVLALTMAACNNDTEQPAAVQPAPGNAGEGIPFSATIATGSATTRALTEDNGTILSSWAKGEQVALIHNGVVDVMTVQNDPDQTTGSVTITGTLTGSPADGDKVTVVFPASAVDATTKAVKTDLLDKQDGTLATIATSMNLRQSDGATLKVGKTTATLNGTVTLANQIAIVKFSLSDGTSALAAKQFEVKDGSSNQVITTVTPASATSDLYVAMAPTTDASFRLDASDGTFLYIYEKSEINLAAGKYYQSPITLLVMELDMDVSASGFSGVYDGLPHGITVTVNSPTDAVVKYGTVDGTYDLTSSPEYIDAGEHTVYYEVTKDKYITVTGSATVTINKAEGTISFSTDAVEKLNSDSAFKEEATLTGDGTISGYSSSVPGVATVAADGTVTIVSTGTTVITATATDGTNYKYTSGSYTLTVKGGGLNGPTTYNGGENPF